MCFRTIPALVVNWPLAFSPDYPAVLVLRQSRLSPEG
jgi:hypothetical protein